MRALSACGNDLQLTESTRKLFYCWLSKRKQTNIVQKPVLWVRDICYGSRTGCGSCYFFVIDLQNANKPKKKNSKFICLLLLKVHLHHSSKLIRSPDITARSQPSKAPTVNVCMYCFKVPYKNLENPRVRKFTLGHLCSVYISQGRICKVLIQIRSRIQINELQILLFSSVAPRCKKSTVSLKRQ